MTVRGAAIWSMSAQYVVFAAQFAVSVLISRFFLSPAEFGIFSIALSAAMMVAILQDFGITRFIVGEPDLGNDKIRACFTVSVVFSCAIALFTMICAWPVSRFYSDARLVPLLAIIAGSYLLVPFAIVPAALLQRRMDFRGIFVVNVGAALASGACALGLAAAGYSALSLAWASVAQQGARAILAQWRSGHRLRLPLTIAGARPILRFGSGASLLYLSGALGGRSPELIIGRLLTFTAVGLYGRAVGLTGQLRQLVGGAIGAVFYPAFARLRDGGDDFAPPYLRVVSANSATAWPAMTFLAASATPIVLILFGPAWAAVAPLLVWIALSEIPFSALPLHMDIPILLGRMRTLLRLNLADTAISIGLLVLGALWSIEWAAASRIGYGIGWFALYAGLMRRLIGFRWTALLRIYAQSLAASLATVLPLLIVYARWQGPDEIGFLMLAACAVAGCLCWFATLFIVRHPVRHELAAIWASTGIALPRAGAMS